MGSLMGSRQGKVLGAFLVVAVLLVAMVASGFFARPDETEDCDGVTRAAGGCDDEQPTFEAADCSGVGTEIGQQIVRRASAIMEGRDARDESKSVRIFEQELLVVQRANQYLRQRGLVETCRAQTLLDAVEDVAPTEFKSQIGDYLYDDGASHPYEQWRREMLQILQVVDQDESAT